jgi:predicted small lipoprotein YifL
MARRNVLWSALALIAGVTIVACGQKNPDQGVPTPAYEERTQIRKQEERRLKELDENSATQAEAQAEYYKQRANDVQKSGGNVQPLLDAAYADKKTLTNEERTQIRKQEERRLTELDENYATQAEAQAEYYKKLAIEVQKSGGNAQPLLDAAAYFDSEANAVRQTGGYQASIPVPDSHW